jgi:diguanylate cyclase (GGDEF)-like protein
MKRFFVNEMESLTSVGFATVILLTMLGVSVALWRLDAWNEEVFELVTRVSLEAEYTHTMHDVIRKRELSIQRMLATNDRFERDDEYVRFTSYAADYALAREKLEGMITSPAIREHYQRVQDAINYTQPFHEQLTEALIHGNLDASEIRAIAQEGSKAQEKVMVLLDRLVSMQLERQQQVVEDYRHTRRQILFLTVLVYLVSIVIAVIVVRQSTQRYKYVSRLSIMDEVTGAYNRRYFDMVLEEEWKRSMREYTPVSLVMVDLDFFKAYNDKFGHQMGDVCLYSLTKIISGQLKRAADFIARYGGEEFAVVLPNTNAENARLLAERIRRSVEEARIQAANDSVSPWVTISVGVATTTAEFNQSSAVLIKAADQAMYKSKQAGRNRVTDVNLADVT